MSCREQFSLGSLVCDTEMIADWSEVSALLRGALGII